MEPNGSSWVDSWGKVPRALAWDLTISEDALRAFIVLSSYADGSSRLHHSSHARLAEDLNVSRTKARLLTAELERAGWIATTTRKRPTLGGWATNETLVAPFPQVTSEGNGQARVVAFASDVKGSEGQTYARADTYAKATTTHESEHGEGKDQARSRPLSDLYLQTSRDSDLSLAQRHKNAVARVNEERNQVPSVELEPQDRTEEQDRVELLPRVEEVAARLDSFHRELDHDQRITTERSLWARLVDAKGFTREEGLLVLARGHAAGDRPGPTYAAAPSAEDWRRQEALANAS